jgi:hypothetical protein
MMTYLKDLLGMPPGRGSVGPGGSTRLPALPTSLIPFALIAAVIGAFVLAYKIAYPSTVYKYRMTVEVEVNGEIRSGSSVIQVERHVNPKWSLSPGMTINRVYGDAVFVDLGLGRNVIAALHVRAGKPTWASAENWPNWRTQPRGGTAFPIPLRRTALADDQMPMFVTFTDINNPKTLLRVNPDRFESIFGNGIKLKAVYVETTLDPITRSITQHLPWFKSLSSGATLGGGSREGDTFTELNVPDDLSRNG